MTEIVASLDWETRSTVDLKKSGLHRYAEDASTQVLCLGWRIGAGAVQSWVPGDPDPQPLLEHVKAGGTVIAHNNAFDRNIWNQKAPAHWPRITVAQCDCTMARAAAMVLPQSLFMLGQVLKAPISKDVQGHRLMMTMCKPRGYDDAGQPIYRDHPDALFKLVEYCKIDVETERLLSSKLPQLSVPEHRLWLLDQTINDRGVAVDATLARTALDVVAVAKLRADKRMQALTQGHVHKVTEVAKLIAWLGGRGIVCESIAKGEVDEIILQTDIFDDAVAREALELRRAAAKSSTAKFQAILNSVCADGRVRGSLRYHGASTGRWAGSGMQPQNFPRIDDSAMVKATLELLAEPYSAPEKCDLIQLFVGEPMTRLSKVLRSCIVAAPGKVLIGGDYANIEGRVNAWLAGEEWKVEAFKQFDAGVGDDLYSLAYSRSFHVPVASVGRPMRQMGKVMELSMGYQGGWRAFEKMGANYGVTVGQERAEQLKVAWRIAHPVITASWWALQDAAIEAVRHPGVTIPVYAGRVQYKVASKFLWCRLPSGRAIVYASPRLVWTEATEDRPSRPQVEFDAVDGITKQWGPHRLYGGLQCENIVQAVARDVLVEGMFRLEQAGYPIVLTIHDENIAEVPRGFGSPDEFAALMAVVPRWAKGLPVAVTAWTDTRYVK